MILAKANHRELRRRPHDFTRNGPLSPELVVTLLLFLIGDANRRGYGHLLDAFWDECASHGIALPTETPVSAAAFCQARAKLSTALLRHVLHLASLHFAQTFDDLWTWRGRRVFAVDGSKFNLSRSDELDRAFGRPGSGPCPQATVSTLVNVSSGLPHDVLVAPYGSCERELLVDHLDVLDEGDVVVLDRGYPSYEILRALLARRLDVLVRVPSSHTFEAIDVFRDSGRDDSRVRIKPPKGTLGNGEPIELRAVKLVHRCGEDSFYLTSLRRAHVSRSAIAELYRKRWEAEELYKLQKAEYFTQRQFHARSAHGVEQEILAQNLYIVIARFLLATAAEHVDAEYHELSVKSAVLGLADYLTRLCLAHPDSATVWLPRLLARIARTRDKRRPGRSFPRRSFKPGPRWGPRGRSRA